MSSFTRHSIYTAHDEAKDKEFELELSWVCEESNGRHQFVPREIALEAERLARVRNFGYIYYDCIFCRLVLLNAYFFVWFHDVGIAE